VILRSLKGRVKKQSQSLGRLCSGVAPLSSAGGESGKKGQLGSMTVSY